ncbi:RagB/SusD family nutrient uptake outer membrane protein [Parabacteroides sp. OttesenSCG-928-O15]|nr:RagB/SusD family nutrient uptake outer membrane protein [Parabacteroides sp. OttesenSCG-928-O15]
MKKIIYIIIASICLISCDTFLDAIPQDKVSEENYWKSENDVVKFLTNIYSNSFPKTRDGSPFWDEAMSDNAYLVWDGWYGGHKYVGNGTHDAYASVPTNMWNKGYTNIRKCYQLIENIDKVSIAEAKKNQIIGETRFLLAYNYHNLVLYFNSVPLVTKVLSMPESKELTQVPKEETIRFILTELDQAYSLLNGKDMDFGRITGGACLALKARVLLFDAQWQSAISATDGLLGKYSLHTQGETPYEDLFSGVAEKSAEIILSIPAEKSSGSIRTGHSVNQAFILKGISGGDPYRAIMPTGSLVDSYPMADGRLIHEAGSTYNPRDPYKERDPRFYQTIIYPTGQIKYLDAATSTIKKTLYDPENPETIALQQYNAPEPSPTGYMWNKYTDWSPYAMNNLTDCTNDIILFRYAEVLLIRAEALAESGGTANKNEICDLLDQLRVRCGGGLIHRDNYNTQEALINLVRNERRVELAGEGLRYWDLLRWKIAEKVTTEFGYGLKGELYGAYMRLDGVGQGDRTVEVDGVPRRFVENRFFEIPKNYLNPIPQSEIDLNPLLKQNPDW